MTTKTFESSLLELAEGKSNETVFRDFLSIIFNQFLSNTKLENVKEIYSRYSNDEIRVQIPDLFSYLLEEIIKKKGTPTGNDVLGAFYQKHLNKNGNPDSQILSWEESRQIGNSVLLPAGIITQHWPVPMLDIGCRSGRILLASKACSDNRYTYLGVEYDFDFVMLASLNLLFNFRTNSEVLWVDRQTKSFKACYRISMIPHGIIKLTDSDKSEAWITYQLQEKLRNSMFK